MTKNFLGVTAVVFLLGFVVFSAVPVWAYEEEPAEDTGEDVAPLDLEEESSPTGQCRAKGETCGAKAKKSKVKECCKSLVCVEGRCQRYQDAEMPCGKGMPPCMPGLDCAGGTCQ